MHAVRGTGDALQRFARASAVLQADGRRVRSTPMTPDKVMAP